MLDLHPTFSAVYSTDLYRRDKRMTDSFEEESKDEEPAVPESEMKAALKPLGRNKSPGFDGIPIELFHTTETESAESGTMF